MVSSSISHYAARRHHLMQQLHNTASTMRQGGAIALVLSAPEVRRNRDVDYPYRQDSYFAYLTGFNEPYAALLLNTQTGEQLIFCRAKDPEKEIWDGRRLGVDAAATTLGVDVAYAITELPTQLVKHLQGRSLVAYVMDDALATTAIQNALPQVKTLIRNGVTSPVMQADLAYWLDEMRLFKDETELSIMRQAATISAHAHIRAMQSCRAGDYEYTLEATLLHEFYRHGSIFPAYGSIVAGGGNACVLHYRENNAQLHDGDLVLIDAGCELHNYASDITRTFPVSGRFSPEQRAIYEIVLDAQRAALAKTYSGQSWQAPHEAALRVLVQGMIDLKFVTGTVDGVIEQGTYKQFYMHKTGHWLGMDVHDCGQYRDLSSPLTEKPWRTLQPNMVLTVEPGFYIQPADNVPEAFWHIGIRIEDDVAITETGHEILSAKAPKTISAIEALMQSM
jgi:Xaa-Pro aminopeptidase